MLLLQTLKNLISFSVKPDQILWEDFKILLMAYTKKGTTWRNTTLFLPYWKSVITFSEGKTQNLRNPYVKIQKNKICNEKY